MKRPAPPVVDVVIAAPAWARALPSPDMFCRKIARAAFAAGAPAALRRRGKAVEISVLLTGDTAIRTLNATYRKRDKATNVLSFPGDARSPAAWGKAPNLILGDVVIAYGTVAKEAKQAAKSLKTHLSHMVVHGVLHLLGYDHETASDARTMERLETEILCQMGFARPYEAALRPARRKKVRRRT